MEKYIKKINDKLLTKSLEEAKKQKKIYKIVGYTLLGVGLAGFVALFISFMVLFLKFNTGDAVTCWFIAIPFLLMLIPGSVLARVGDVLEKEPHPEEDKKSEETDK